LVCSAHFLTSLSEGTILDALGLGYLKRPSVPQSQSGGGGQSSRVNLTRKNSDASEGSEESRMSQESRFAQETRFVQEKRKQDESSEKDSARQPVPARNHQAYTPHLKNITEDREVGSVVDGTPLKKKQKCIDISH
jgi:hypothetical protein